MHIGRNRIPSLRLHGKVWRVSCLLSSICQQRQLPTALLQLYGLTWAAHQVSETLSSLQLYALLLEERLNCIHWEAEASCSDCSV